MKLTLTIENDRPRVHVVGEFFGDRVILTTYPRTSTTSLGRDPDLTVGEKRVALGDNLPASALNLLPHRFEGDLKAWAPLLRELVRLGAI